jgi:threonine dehydratase
MSTPPTSVDLAAARKIVGRHLPRTPLLRSSELSRRLGFDTYIKYENHGPIRSFKARGALCALARLEASTRAAGVVTASTGNHGQGVALAGANLGIPATIVVPEGMPPIKTRAIQDFGGELVVAGGDLAEAAAHAHALATETGATYIEDGEDAGLMAGAATIGCEIFEDLPGVTDIIVPVGGGNLIAGVSLATSLHKPRTRVIGAQSDAAPSVVESWRAGVIVHAPCATFAGGLATSFPGQLAFSVLAPGVSDMKLVSEQDLRDGIVELLRTTGQVAEGAGAAAYAAAKRFSPEFAGRTVVLILSGGNIDAWDLEDLLARAEPAG